MEKSLYEAAKVGNVNLLLQLLQQDALLLDRFIAARYTETPLHIASMLGHLEFVQEILTRKPELAKELDSRKSSPLHLATAKGYLEIVKRLLQANPDMCFVCDQDGRNPLHVAVIKGHVSILRDLVHARPRAARALMDGGDTILHACVRHNQLESMKFLVEAISDPHFLNYKNYDGNTVLHLAVADRQLEAVNFLITCPIEVNWTNADGLRALDILSQNERHVKDKEIAESLRSAGAVRARGNPLSKHQLNDMRKQILLSPSSTQNNPLSRKTRRSKVFSNSNKHVEWLQKQRKSLMIVASLNATMAFQAALTPPGGGGPASLSGPPSASAPTPFTAQPPANYDSFWNFLVKLDCSIDDPDNPKRFDSLFFGFNTASFLASLSIILLLISGLPLRQRFFMWILMVIMWIAITALAMAYLMVILHRYPTTNQHDQVLKVAIFLVLVLVWIGLMLLLLLGHTIRLLAKMIRSLINLITCRRRPLMSSMV